MMLASVLAISRGTGDRLGGVSCVWPSIPAVPSSSSHSALGAIAAAARALAACTRLLVLTGAGSSKDAGVPTFRCADGLWRDHKPEDLAAPEGFARNPDLVWDWYRERRLLIARAQPHVGQRAIALLQQHYPAPGKVLVATTNEDDLFDRAGVAGVVHLHGSLFETACSAGCGWRHLDAFDNGLSMQPCPACGARTRPGSTWYGESLPKGVLESIAAFKPDGCLLIGSSCLVQPTSVIAPELIAAGCPVVEINPEETPISPLAACSLRATAKDAIPPLVDLLTSPTVRDQKRRIT